MILHSFEAAVTKNCVGVPIAERDVIEGLVVRAPAILSPRRGFGLFAFTELDSDRGRPDVALVAMSPASLRARLHRGMRHRTASEARVLAALWTALIPSIQTLTSGPWPPGLGHPGL